MTKAFYDKVEIEKYYIETGYIENEDKNIYEFVERIHLQGKPSSDKSIETIAELNFVPESDIITGPKRPSKGLVKIYRPKRLFDFYINMLQNSGTIEFTFDDLNTPTPYFQLHFWK